MSLKYLGLIAAFGLVGCDSDGITGGQRTVADLAGTWSMSRFELMNAVDTTQRRWPSCGRDRRRGTQASCAPSGSRTG